MNQQAAWVLAALLAALPQVCSAQPTSRPAKAEAELPPEFKQLLPRGRIAAIRNPRFVPADEARISPDAWVMGVVVEGQARAYSLNLLNRHEIVNDEAGGTPFAAVW